MNYFTVLLFDLGHLVFSKFNSRILCGYFGKKKSNLHFPVLSAICSNIQQKKVLRD